MCVGCAVSVDKFAYVNVSVPGFAYLMNKKLGLLPKGDETSHREGSGGTTT
jgi:hypothetical protein